jgi:hypothetical protein
MNRVSHVRLSALLLLTVGAFLLGGPLAFAAWYWSHSPLIGPILIVGMNIDDTAVIESNWNFRLIEPRQLSKSDKETILQAWRRQEYLARLRVVFYTWASLSTAIIITVAIIAVRQRYQRTART